MTTRDPERFKDTNNLFVLTVLSNNDFEFYAKYAKEFGHPDSMTKEQVKLYADTLNNLKNNNLEIYKRLYRKLHSLILDDNFNGVSNPYRIFARVREFGIYIDMIIKSEKTLDSICKEYEERQELID